MQRIKRTKGDAVHWVASVTPRGNVTLLVADKDKAGEFTDEMAAKVKAFYAKRKEAGTFTFETVAEPPKPAPAETPKPAPPAAVTPTPTAPKPAAEQPKPEHEKAGRKAVK